MHYICIVAYDFTHSFFFFRCLHYTITPVSVMKDVAFLRSSISPYSFLWREMFHWLHLTAPCIHRVSPSVKAQELSYTRASTCENVRKPSLICKKTLLLIIQSHYLPIKLCSSATFSRWATDPCRNSTWPFTSILTDTKIWTTHEGQSWLWYKLSWKVLKWFTECKNRIKHFKPKI